MKQHNHKSTVFMTGPADTVKGGIRTVVNQYLSYKDWGMVELRHIPTHVEGSILKRMVFFTVQFCKLVIAAVIYKPEIIHMHVSERGSFWRKSIILNVFRLLGVKTILHHHGAEFFSFYEHSSPANKKRITRTVEKADINLVLSGYHCQMMRERFPKGKFKVLYNAIPPADGDIYDPDASGILFVGRLGERKGTYDLIAALEKLENILSPDVKVYFCGDGEVDRVSEVMREKNLEHRVAHVGWCSKSRLREFYGKSMVFVLPSYHEGLPMSLLEAMYAGIPCITTRVDGIPELVISGNNGLLVDPGCPEQIKNCLHQLVLDREMRKTLGKNAYYTVQKQFLLKKHIDNLETLYLQLEGENYD